MGNDSFGKLLLRLSLGIMILLHGIAKVMHPGSIGFIKTRLADNGLPELLVYGVYAGEILAPVLIILGLFTRFGGLLIAVNMVFAIALAHSVELFLLTKHGGWALELQGMYLFGGLALAFMGSGRFAVRPD